MPPSNKVPNVVVEYVNRHIESPVALIGCRAHHDVSFGCCEYDLAVFAHGANSIVKLDKDHTVELIHFAGTPKKSFPDGKRRILRDSNDLSLSSLVQNHSVADDVDNKSTKFLVAQGRKLLVNSLFHQGKVDDYISKSPVVSAMFLKFSSYEFIQGVLMLVGSRPMPVHELRMIRQADLASQDTISGVELSLDSIGIERATRPTIQRARESVKGLTSGQYDSELNLTKIDFLLENDMLADCYYFIGRLLTDLLAAKSAEFYVTYSKIVQISMDLAVNTGGIEKRRQELSRITKKILTN